MRRTRPLEERYWEKVDKRGPDECWPWKAARNVKGYGRFYFNSRYGPATHAALTLAGRPKPPTAEEACHTCDNPPCVNPAHLWWGTGSENARDKIAKGRDHNASRAHCPKGHPFSGDNVLSGVDRNGHRFRRCMTCERARWLRLAERRREKVEAAKQEPAHAS